MKRITFT